PARGLAAILGLSAIAALCVGMGALTSGGKLFTGLYAAVWYMAMSGAPGADATGALGKAPDLALSAAYLGGGLLLVGAALLKERRSVGSPLLTVSRAPRPA